MANDGKIYIIVTDQLPGGSGPLVPDSESSNSKKSEKDKSILGDFAKHQFFNLIQSQAKSAINYSISNIGNFYGDYAAQQHMQEAMEIANFATGLGVSALAGFKMAGLPGAIIATSTQLISGGIKTAQQYYSGLVQNERQNRMIDQLRTRAGLNSTNNGNRGTEY